MKKLISILAFVGAAVAAPVMASEAGYPLETAPDRINSVVSLQNGAKLFVNYCLNCHAASSMRYNRLRDIGLTDDQIRQNLLFSADKVGELMKTSMNAKESKEWFGATPPDLSVIARARGTDWLYTYMRTFYRDESRATGWNNLVFPSVGMPHVLWELQGQRAAKFETKKDPHDASKTVHEFVGFEQLTPGKLNSREYDEAVGDLVTYLNWMAEPAQSQRKRLGVWVLLFLGVFTVLAWRLNAAYWKDVK